MGPATPEPPFHLRRWTLVPQLRTPFHRRNSFTGSGHGSAPPKPIPCRNIFSALDNESCNTRTPVPPAAVDIGAATPNTIPPPKLVYRQWTMGLHLLTRSHAEIYFQP